jgi:ABC-type polysaccharide/polyol phosphate export permease
MQLGNVPGHRPLALLARHWRLIRTLTLRDLQARYRESAGGVLWAVLHPLVLLLLYTFVFSTVLQIRLGPEAGTPYFAIFLLVGLLPWQAVHEALTRSTTVLLEHPTLVKRTPFPTEILPAFVTLSALVTQLVATALLIGLLVALGHPPRASLALFPLLLALQAALTLGLGWALASLNVYLRDVGHVLGIGLTLWVFLTPIFYPSTLFPPAARFLLLANPLAILVEAYRAILIRAAWPDPGPLLLLIVAAAALLGGGFWLFRRLEPGFADVM